MNRFEENVELWSHHHPKEAVWLQYLDCDHLEFCQTERGEPNLKLQSNGEALYYHSTKDAAREAQEWFDGLDLIDVDVLYVYGVGLGYAFTPLKTWLKENPNRQVVFLEDDLAVIHRLFETDLGAEILEMEQSHLYFFKEISDTDAIFNELFWSFLMAKIDIVCSKLYQETKPEKFSDLQHKIAYDAAIKQGLLDEYLQYGAAFFQNFYPNMMRLHEAYLGNELFGKFEAVPAIICGAGPSLQKNIEVLKTLEDKALIFAGSSALNALTSAGITPSFGAGIDPNPMQEERLSKVKSIDFPFFYRNRLNPKALNLVKGPKLYITGSGGYDISTWFEQRFGIFEEPIEEGHNVVNFCLEIAHAMGCDPIIFVGMDLAYTDNKLYVSGVVKDEVVTKEFLEGNNELHEVAFERKDVNGEPVYTLWKWISEAKWIGDFAKLHEEKTLINATEGGLGFPDVPNATLAEVAQKYLQKKLDLRPRVQNEIENCEMPQVTKEGIVEAMRDLKEGLERCLELLETLESENQKLKKEMKKTKNADHLQTGEGALAETELSEDSVFAYMLEIFNSVYSRVLYKDLKALADPTADLTDVEIALAKLDLNAKKFAFLKNVALANIHLIREALGE